MQNINSEIEKVLKDPQFYDQDALKKLKNNKKINKDITIKQFEQLKKNYNNKILKIYENEQENSDFKTLYNNYLDIKLDTSSWE